MTSLLETRLEVLLLFFPFVCCQDLGWVPGPVGFGVNIGDADVDNAISAAGPKAADQHVSSVVTAILVKIARDWRDRVFWVCLLICGATGVYSGFVGRGYLYRY